MFDVLPHNIIIKIIASYPPTILRLTRTCRSIFQHLLSNKNICEIWVALEPYESEYYFMIYYPEVEIKILAECFRILCESRVSCETIMLILMEISCGRSFISFDHNVAVPQLCQDQYFPAIQYIMGLDEDEEDNILYYSCRSRQFNGELIRWYIDNHKPDFEYVLYCFVYLMAYCEDLKLEDDIESFLIYLRKNSCKSDEDKYIIMNPYIKFYDIEIVDQYLYITYNYGGNMERLRFSNVPAENIEWFRENFELSNAKICIIV